MKLGIDELKIAKQVAHDVWNKYDDTFGYRSDKQAANEAVSIENPDNIWYFWGQFDMHNHQDFIRRVNMYSSAAGTNLSAWCDEQFKEESKALESLREAGFNL